MKMYVLIIACSLGSLTVYTHEETSQQTPTQNTQQSPAPVCKSAQQEEPDFGIPMLATFLTQIVPGIAKTIVGSKKNAPELAIEGTQQLSTGIVTFLSLIPTRNDVCFLTALQDPKMLETYLQQHADEPAFKDMLVALEQLQVALSAQV